MKNISVAIFVILLFSVSYSARFRADTVYATKGGYVYGALVPAAASADSLIGIVSGDSVARKVPTPHKVPYLEHGVTPGTLPIAATDSTFSNSPIYKTGEVLNVFGYDSSVINDTLTDGFNRVGEDPLDSLWYNSGGFAGHFRVTINGAEPTGQAVSVCTSGTFGNNHYSYANGGAVMGVCARMDTAANGYVFITTAGLRGYLFKCVSKVFTKIDSTSGTIATPTFDWISAVGDTIKCYSYGASEYPLPSITRYDTTFRSGGRPGIYGTSSTTLNSWIGGGYGGTSYTYSDSALKVNGILRIANVPSSSSDTALVKDGDTVALRAISTFDTDFDSLSVGGGQKLNKFTIVSDSLFLIFGADTFYVATKK